MDFTKFTKEELIGRKVLVFGQHRKSIAEIKKVGKATISVGESETKFALSTGRLWGGSVWSASWIELLSEERAKEITDKWKAQKEIDTLRGDLHSKLKDATLEQLQQIKELLTQ